LVALNEGYFWSKHKYKCGGVAAGKDTALHIFNLSRKVYKSVL